MAYKFNPLARRFEFVDPSDGSNLLTLNIDPGNTGVLDQFVTENFRQADYLINIFDETDSKYKGVKLSVLKTDSEVKTSVYSVNGDILNVFLDADFSGLNTEVFLINNTLNTLEITYSRNII